MALQALQQEQIQQTVQVLLAFLDSENVVVPGNLVEGVVSGKSILRGLLSGNLVLAQQVPDAPPAKVEEAQAKDSKKKPPKAA